MNLVISASRFGSYLIFFEQWAGHRLLSEKVTGPHVGANRLIFFPLFLCQRELKFDMVANSSVAWYVPLPSCLVFRGQEGDGLHVRVRERVVGKEQQTYEQHGHNRKCRDH